MQLLTGTDLQSDVPTELGRESVAVDLLELKYSSISLRAFKLSCSHLTWSGTTSWWQELSGKAKGNSLLTIDSFFRSNLVTTKIGGNRRKMKFLSLSFERKPVYG